MWNEAKPFVGWSIGEAIRRCADPDLLSRWFADHRSWRAGGIRTRFTYRNEQIEGIEAARQNDGQRALKALLVQRATLAPHVAHIRARGTQRSSAGRAGSSIKAYHMMPDRICIGFFNTRHREVSPPDALLIASVLQHVRGLVLFQHWDVDLTAPAAQELDNLRCLLSAGRRLLPDTIPHLASPNPRLRWAGCTKSNRLRCGRRRSATGRFLP